MFDMLPFPHTIGKNTEEKVEELVSYLIQFKETLEFILTNISKENLSPELLNTLKNLGAKIEKTQEEKEEELQQAIAISAADVISTDVFKSALEREYRFTVNYNTGELEYSKP